MKEFVFVCELHVFQNAHVKKEPKKKRRVDVSEKQNLDVILRKMASVYSVPVTAMMWVASIFFFSISNPIPYGELNNR